MEESLIFNLSKELEYSKSGEFKKTATIEFVPPNMDQYDEVADFDQIFMGAVISAGNFAGKGQAESSKDENAMENFKKNAPTAEELKIMLFLSQDIKIRDLAKKFKILATKVGKLDDNTLLKDSHFKKMSIDDFNRMICEYAAFFTFPSLLRGE